MDAVSHWNLETFARCFTIAEVAEFGFALLDEPGTWGGRYTPLDVLAPLLSGEGMTTTSTGRAISMSPFFVDYDMVANFRARLIERIIALLGAKDPRVAYRATLFLNNAVRSPHGILNSVVPNNLLRQYEAEFGQTIGRIGALIVGATLAPTTVIGLVRSLSWYAQFDEGELGDQVRSIFTTIPHDLDFRFHAALAEGAEYSFVGQVPYVDWKGDREWLRDLVAELLASYPDRRALCAAFLAHCETVEAAGMSTFPSKELIDQLIAADPAIGHEIIDRSLVEPGIRLSDFLCVAVGALIETRPEEGRGLIARMLASPEPKIRLEGARGLIGLKREQSAEDIDLMREALGAKDPVVVSTAAAALRTWRDLEDRETIALALVVSFDRVPSLFEAVCIMLCGRRSALLDHLRAEDVCLLLKRMMALPRLEGYWAGEMLTGLAKRYGVLLAQFLLARADLGLSDEAPEDFRAIGYSHRRGSLALQESPAVSDIFERAWLWLRHHDGATGWARHQIGEVFAAMFKLDSTPVVEFLDSMLDRAMVGDLRWIGDILRNTHHRFVFEHCGFVERYLNRCKAVEAKLVKDVIGQLSAAAMSGMWSGTPGEPMPRDIQARNDATAVLATLSRLSPAYPLYKAIVEHSKQNIARSIAESEALDADE